MTRQSRFRRCHFSKWRSRAIATSLAILVSGSGCSNQTRADDTTPTADGSASPLPDTPPPASTAAAALTIEGFGLTVSPPGAEKARAVRFSEGQAATISAISQVLGKPEQEGTNSDCPSGPVQFASWSKGLSANFQDGKFVGWAGAVDQKTMRGIGFGTTKADLVKAYHPSFEQTSLGYEFSVEGISGVMESDADDASITDLWAGVSCIAR